MASFAARRPFSAPIVALAVFLLAGAASAGLIWRMEQYRLQERRAIVADMAGDHADAIARNIERALSAAHALAALLRHGNYALPDFDAVGRQLLPHYPGVAGLSLAPGGVIRGVVPLAGNEKALNLDLLNNPATKKEALIARDTGKLTLVGPFELVSGKLAAIGRLPIFLEGGNGNRSFWGFINIEIRFPETLEAARLPDLAEQGYAYELWRTHPENGTRQTIAASFSAALVDPVEQALKVPNATWTLSVMPVKGWGDPLGLSLKGALGLLFSVLLAYVAKLIVAAKAHAKSLETLVAQRTAQVAASEARFRSLAEMSSDFYWETDAEHRLVSGTWDDPRVASTWHPAIGKRRWELPSLSPDEAGWQAHREMLDARLPFRDFQLSRLDSGGTERYLSLSGDPLFDAFGAFVGYRGVATDITERKRAEKALRAAEEQFRGLVEQSIAGIYIIQDGKITYVNPRAAEILGLGSTDELISADPLLWVAEPDRGKVAESMRRLIEGEARSVALDFDVLRRDGVTIRVGANAARAPHEGRPAIIGLMQDISEKRRAEEEIRRYVEQLKTAFMSTVEVATTLSEMRDPYTAGHERRVAEIAVAIGAELGFDARRQEGLRVAGYLHDIGKITIPAEILSKPSQLSPIEMQLIRAHPQASYEVLRSVEFPWPVAQVALQHHERMDGSGYPQGLKGEDILLEARIMAVADVIEAMASHRPYRPGLGIERALAEIERGRGTAYDSDVAQACLRLFRDKHYRLPA